MAKNDDDFTFPTLPSSEKTPLTTESTVRDATTGEVSPIALHQGWPDGASVRQKVLLAPGYSQVSWMAKCQKERRLGIGNLEFNKAMTRAEVRQHKTVDDAWIVIRQKVYNLTPYLNYHPGGIDILKPVLGKDATLLFEKYHRWVNVDALLQACWLGMLES